MLGYLYMSKIMQKISKSLLLLSLLLSLLGRDFLDGLNAKA
ncbi:MAG: hypothetical protein Q8Q23_02245 [bacterium]|nr:hypothetical protein [bacterium]